MSNHPNRSRANPSAARNPTPQEIAEARERAGLTQKAAAELVYTPVRTWEGWEMGKSPMHPAAFELFIAKTTGAHGFRWTPALSEQRGSYRVALDSLPIKDEASWIVTERDETKDEVAVWTEDEMAARDVATGLRSEGKTVELWRAVRVEP